MPTTSVSSEPRPAVETTSWGRILLVVGAGVAASFQIGKVPPVLPLMQVDLSLSLLMAGWLLSSFYVLGVLASPAAGALGDWLGYRRMILLGLGLQCLGSLAGAASGGVPLLMVTRLLEGLGYVFVAVAAPGLILRLTAPEQRRIAMGLWSCFMPTGGALMMVAAPWLASALTWRGLWLVNGLLALVYILVLRWGVRALPRRPRAGRFSPLSLAGDVWLAVRSGGPVWAGLCFMSFAAMFFAVIGFLPTMLVVDEGLGMQTASLLGALVLGSNVAGNLTAGVLLQRGWPRWLLVTVTLVFMGLCSLGIYTPLLPVGLRVALCVAFSAVGGLLPVAVIEGAGATAPEPRLLSTSTGLVMQGAQAGLLFGPPVLAMVVSWPGGWRNAPWFLVGAAIFGLVAAQGFRRVEERRFGKRARS